MATTHWTTVYAGPPGEVVVMQAMLQANGLDTFLPDESTQTADPFITGTFAMFQTLQVPDAQVAQARELLEGAHPTAPKALPSEEDAPAEAAGADADADLEEDLIQAKLDGYILPCVLFTVLGVTTPLTFVVAWYYLKACERYGRRSRLHVVVLLCVAASLLALGLMGWTALYAIPHE